MRPQRKRIVQNNSDDGTSDSDSDTPVVNGGATASAAPKRGRGRPKGTKRQRVVNRSDDDQSPQPSTSGVADSQRTQKNNSQDSDEQNESSGEETPDSDYIPVADDTRPAKKRGRPSARTSPRRKKNMPNYSLRNAKSNKQNGTASARHLINSDKASTSSQNETSDTSHLSSSKLSRLTQPGSKDALDSSTVDILAYKCVYFLLIEDQKKYAIKKKAIVTHVFKDDNYSSKLYTAVIVKASSILMKTFGLELLQLEHQKDSYILINVLKHDLLEDFVELTRTKHQQHGLILFLLTIIFMNGNCITEDELIRTLKPLRIDLTSKRPHPVFGDVRKYITNELVKQMYLNYECVNKDPPRFEITWGPRAKQEVDKKDLLAFACQIMDDTTPENWILQYKDAEESVI